MCKIAVMKHAVPAAVFFAFGCSTVLRAEEWTQHDVGIFAVHAPANWNFATGDAPNTAVVQSTRPDSVVFLFITDPSTYRAACRTFIRFGRYSAMSLLRCRVSTRVTRIRTAGEWQAQVQSAPTHAVPIPQTSFGSNSLPL